VPYVDLHLHTTASDGTLSPPQACKLAKEISVLFIATDHDTTAGQRALLSLCPEATWPEVYAMERTSGASLEFEGRQYPAHFNVFCPFNFSQRDVPNELHKAYEWAEANGCVIQWNHPTYWVGKFPIMRLASFIGEGAKHAHLIELSNGNHTFLQDYLAYAGLVKFAFGWKGLLMHAVIPGTYARALERLPRELANLSLAKPTANTDAHLPSAYGQNYNFVDESFVERGWNGFYEAVKLGAIVPARTKRAPLCVRLTELAKWGKYTGLPLDKIAWFVGRYVVPCGLNEQVIKWWSSLEWSWKE
jgi:hypothetical protein